MEKRLVFEFWGHLHRIETKVDGSGRIHLDIDRECFDVLQALQKHQFEKGLTIAIAAVPLLPGEPMPNISVEEAPYAEVEIDEDPTLVIELPEIEPADDTEIIIKTPKAQTVKY